MNIKHLGKRFFGSLSKAPLDDEDAQWVKSNLLETEHELWMKMSRADQRHAVAVAHRTVELLGDLATRPVIAAALLHDIGKIETRVNTFERVLATLAGTQASRSQVESWAEESGWLGRAGRYLNHHEIGASMLTTARSDQLTIAWAREHELSTSEWTLPADISHALWKADNH